MSRDYILQNFRPAIDFQIDYARELNEQQHAAVTAPPGPSLVIAGAGSGKTRTLTYRVAFLLEQGIPPERILLLTFTNKAAREMMNRVNSLLNQELSALWGGTFHSIGNRILRRHADLVGYKKDFTIADREDASDLLDACLTDSKIDIKAIRFPKADVLGDIFSMSINKRQSISETLKDQYDYFSMHTQPIEQLFEAYRERKKKSNAMDFDDLLVLWLQLMEQNAEVRELYQRRFQFVLVDEYQDTNKLQAELIDTLVTRHHNLMVVGDDSQSIYSWRGANFANIWKFPERYPEAKTYKIETNYRSTPEILDLANSVIAANVRQFEKKLTPARPSGIKPILVACGDGGEQAAFVAQRMLELREEGVSLKDMAVLYRSHFHALELQLELTRRNIPFSITSGIRFFEQAHVKDVCAYLKFVSNPEDELGFKRIVKLMPGVGGKSADKLWSNFLQYRAATPSVPLANSLQGISPGVPKKAAVCWAQFLATLSQLETAPVAGNPSKMISLVLEASYEEYLQEEYPNYRQRLEDLEQLAQFALRFPTVEEFLTQLALYSNVDEDSASARDDEQVRLSTIHQAKGLEFDVVFSIMLCDGMFPSSRSMETTEGEEEERRLFYVTVTRARNELYLTYPLIRMIHGSMNDAMQQPSRFLTEINPSLLDTWNLRTY